MSRRSGWWRSRVVALAPSLYIPVATVISPSYASAHISVPILTRYSHSIAGHPIPTAHAHAQEGYTIEYSYNTRSFTRTHSMRTSICAHAQDMACIDRNNIEQSLACLPVFLAGCQTLLVVAGPTYCSRLWCVMELFTFTLSMALAI